MNHSFWEYLDIHGMKIILVVIIFLVGFFVGVNVEEEPEQPCGKIIFESNHLKGLTEEEISRKFTEWLNDNVEVTIRIKPEDDWEYSGNFVEIVEPTDLIELP